MELATRPQSAPLRAEHQGKDDDVLGDDHYDDDDAPLGAECRGKDDDAY